MRTNILATAVALTDEDLLARVHTLARTERESAAELIAHLTALELRPTLYLADGYGSLFDYCTRSLGLSEDAACTRTNVVRVCRRFPVILDHLFSGALTLTSVRLLAPHLTAENHEAVLARAKSKRKEEIEALVVELAPRPDVPATVRKLPAPKAARPVWMDTVSDLVTALGPPARREEAFPSTSIALADRPGLAAGSSTVTPDTRTTSTDVWSATVIDKDDAGQDRFVLSAPSPNPPRHRPIVQALAPQRYRVQFTIGQKAHDDLRTVQALLRREIPNGDAGAIFERALALLRREVEKSKLGRVAKPRRTPVARSDGNVYENRIRSRTDRHTAQDASEANPQPATGSGEPGHEQDPAARERVGAPQEGQTAPMRHERAPSRHIPGAVKRVVWFRDRGQCAFVSATGRRCAERSFLELHHIQPYALHGPATAGNIALRCRRHNQYEAEVIFGPRRTGVAG